MRNKGSREDFLKDQANFIQYFITILESESLL